MSEASSERFDPTRYLIKLSRRQRSADGQYRTIESDYLQVRDRILWLRHDHPDARIETEIVQFDSVHCVVKARIEVPAGGVATGIGTETADDWRDFPEKAETKAIGRALGALGYGTQFAVDFDLDQGGDRVVDAPVQRLNEAQKPAARPLRPHEQQEAVRDALPDDLPPLSAYDASASRPVGGWQERPATEPQRKALYAIGRGAAQMGEAEIETWVHQQTGKTIDDLSRREASALIDALKLKAGVPA